MTNLAIIPLFLGGMRGWQLIIVICVVLLLFGGKKIPDLMRNLGKSVHSFRQGMEDAKAELNKPIQKADDKPADTDKPA